MVLLKIVLTGTFVFDKNATLSVGYLHLVSFAICLTILCKRLMTAIMVNKSVYYASIVYETLISWLFLTLGCHIITSTEDSSSSKGEAVYITTIAMLIVSGIIMGILLALLQEMRFYKRVLNEKIELQLFSASEHNHYFFSVFTLISNFDTDHSAKMILNGLL